MKKTAIIFTISLLLSAVLFSCGNGGGAEDAIEDTSFSIGYNSNGAESGTAPAVQSGSGKAVLAVSANTGSLAKNGYLFDGWNTSADGSGADYTPGALYNGKNITLYAKWARLFNYEVNSISPAPAMEGVQKAPGVPTATITGLTARGRQLSSVNIPESIDGYTVSDIDDNAFQNCGNISNVTIPDTVTNIGNNAFAGCINMHDMTLLGTIPPTMGAGVFVSCSMIISVPQTAVGAYQGAAGWTTYSTSIVYIGASTYSIIYDDNGSDSGTIPLMQVSLTGGYPLEVYGNIGELTRAGCTFSGWNTSPDGKGLNFAAGSKFPGPGRLTLYAKWTHPDYTVTFDGQGADTPANPASQHVIAPANTVVLPEAPIRAGYTFAGWYTETNGQGTQLTSSTIIYGNMTVYAKWNEGIFQITYNANGANSGSVPSSQKGVTNNNVTISGNTGNLQKTGCKFMDWNTKADGSGDSYTSGVLYSGPKDIILYAQWVNIFKIKIDKSTNGKVIADVTENIIPGTIVTLTIVPNSGYQLDALQVADIDNNVVSSTLLALKTSYTFIMPSIDVRVSSTFKTFNPTYKNFQNIDKGDLVLKNGKYVDRASFNNNPSAYMSISLPAGVVAYKGLNGSYGYTGKTYMIGLNECSPVKWAPSGTVGAKLRFETSNTTGEQNWGVIASVDPEGVLYSDTNYPAFFYANNYSAGGIYTNGWFLPSAYELSQIKCNWEYINNTLIKIKAAGGVVTLSPEQYPKKKSYWSSSVSDGRVTSKVLDWDSTGFGYTTSTSFVCAVRALDD